MNGKAQDQLLVVYTIGHSDQPTEALIKLLKDNGIEVVADIRSSPFSSHAPQHNRPLMEQELREKGIRYLFLGDVLGGRPSEESFYDADGHVCYSRIAESPQFLKGIDEIMAGAGKHRIALLCGEEDPTHCHRRLLVGKVLTERGVQMVHIRAEGRLQEESVLAAQEEFRRTQGQQELFDMKDEERWRSTRSVSPRKARANSSRR